MKKYFVLFIGCFIAFSLPAQNLVANPSFEDSTQCPGGLGQMFVIGWNSPTWASPDYFHACNSNGIVDVPQNFFGWESAKTGNAYTGVYTANSKLPPPTDYREYIQSKLLDTLVAGLEYYVSFHVSLGDSMGFACNNIGAYFSSIPPTATNAMVLSFVPQIDNDPSLNQLINSFGWTLVADTLTAIGGELYITIGNFHNAANSDTVPFGGHYAYYYIDDVSVTVCDSQTGVNEQTLSKLVTVYPNPGSGLFEIAARQVKIQQAEVFNLFGARVFYEASPTAIDLASEPAGIYFAKIRTNLGVVSKKVIIKK